MIATAPRTRTCPPLAGPVERPEVEAPRFASLLRRHRLAAGLSQEALAERANLSPSAITALESGKRQAPYRGTVRALATALGLAGPQRAALEGAVSRTRGPRAPASPAEAPGAKALP